jgi:hypothetical protein
MTTARRWAIVAVGTALLALAPFLVGRIPAGHSKISAAALLTQIRASAGVHYSGNAQATGGLALPVTSQFGSLDDLLGGDTTMRVWWRGGQDWRVDAIDLTGEQDLHQDRNGTWSWDYESNTAVRDTYAAPPEVRLPRSDDLVPAVLARRLLSQAVPGEVTRLPDARIAGRDAAGLRLRPRQGQTTITHIDVWALPSSGLALRVNVYGRGSSRAVVSTSMLDVSLGRPSASTTAFRPPTGARVRFEDAPDVVSSIDAFAPVHPPAVLAGLPRARERPGSQLGSVGVYGRGVTLLVALPLPARLARTVARQLSGTVDVNTGNDTTALTIGPLNLRLTPRDFSGSRWLLSGTVTAATLATAATELPSVFGHHR